MISETRVELTPGSSWPGSTRPVKGPSRVLGIHCTKPTGGTTEMMTQEEFMDVMAMKRQGLTIKEIAEETGYHPSTISSWLKNGGPPTKRSSPPRR